MFESRYCYDAMGYVCVMFAVAIHLLLSGADTVDNCWLTLCTVVDSIGWLQDSIKKIALVRIGNISQFVVFT